MAGHLDTGSIIEIVDGIDGCEVGDDQAAVPIHKPNGAGVILGVVPAVLRGGDRVGPRIQRWLIDHRFLAGRSNGGQMHCIDALNASRRLILHRIDIACLWIGRNCDAKLVEFRPTADWPTGNTAIAGALQNFLIRRVRGKARDVKKMIPVYGRTGV